MRRSSRVRSGRYCGVGDRAGLTGVERRRRLGPFLRPSRAVAGVLVPACVVARRRSGLFREVRPLDGLENIREAGGLVLRRRVLPTFERVEFFPRLLRFRNVDSRCARSQTRRFAKLGTRPLVSLRPSPCVCEPVGYLYRLQFSLPLELGFLLFGRVGVVLVGIQPLTQRFYRVAWEPDAITLRTTWSVVPTRSEGAAASAVKCFDACQGAPFSAGQLVDRM